MCAYICMPTPFIDFCEVLTLISNKIALFAFVPRVIYTRYFSLRITKYLEEVERKESILGKINVIWGECEKGWSFKT